jgi:hypothetical protein
MACSDLTDRTRTGPFLGSHLSDTVRRLSADCASHLTVRFRSVICEPRTARSAAARRLFSDSPGPIR